MNTGYCPCQHGIRTSGRKISSKREKNNSNKIEEGERITIWRDDNQEEEEEKEEKEEEEEEEEKGLL